MNYNRQRIFAFDVGEVTVWVNMLEYGFAGYSQIEQGVETSLL